MGRQPELQQHHHRRNQLHQELDNHQEPRIKHLSLHQLHQDSVRGLEVQAHGLIISHLHQELDKQPELQPNNSRDFQLQQESDKRQDKQRLIDLIKLLHQAVGRGLDLPVIRYPLMQLHKSLTC